MFQWISLNEYAMHNCQSCLSFCLVNRAHYYTTTIVCLLR